MSKLSEILKEYRQSCFLAKDIDLDVRAVTLLANQEIVSKNAIKALMLELIKESAKEAHSGTEHIEILTEKVEQL